MNVLEMKCLRSLVGVSRSDRVRNEEVDEERRDEYRMARRVLMTEASGGRVRGRPRLGWMDGVKVSYAIEE